MQYYTALFIYYLNIFLYWYIKYLLILILYGYVYTRKYKYKYVYVCVCVLYIVHKVHVNVIIHLSRHYVLPSYESLVLVLSQY